MGLRTGLLRLAAVVLVPLVFLLGLEGLLRAVGYGRETSFFVETRDGEAWTTNPAFSSRFFAPGYRLLPEPARVPRTKPPDELRIVVLGGSAAFGDLDPGYGFARFLATMLELSHPERRIRVVLAALSGANSHLMRLVARDARVLEPDLFVVLLGNNEVVGPFGPGAFLGDAEARPRVPSLASIRTGLFLGSTRVGQLLGALLRRPLAAPVVERPVPGESGPLPRVAADDPGLRKAYANYASNLDAIVETAADVGAPVLLCTVPVNLRDTEPRASLHGDGLAAADLAAWEEQVRQGDSLLSQRQYAEALDRYRRAAAIDPAFAALHHRMGRALDALGQAEEADAAFVRARDLDALRARADSEINAIVRRTAERHANATLLDLERALGPHAPGRRLFYDHVHFTLRGNHEVARLVFEALPGPLGLEAREPPGFASVRAALPVTVWDRTLLAHRQASRGLLPGQQRARPPARPSRGALVAAEREYLDALSRRPDDLRVLDLLTELRLTLGESGQALESADALLAALRNVPRWHRLRGAALVQLERRDEALAEFDEAVALDPDDFESRVGRARLRLRQGDREGAVADLRAAQRARPRDADIARLLEEASASLRAP